MVLTFKNYKSCRKEKGGKNATGNLIFTRLIYYSLT